MANSDTTQTKANKRNLRPSSICRPNGENGNIISDLNELYRYIEDKAIDAIEWYITDKIPKAHWSQVLRLLTILFTTIGGVLPILAGLKLSWCTSESCSQWGYIALALAAACVGMDKFFGFSSAWMRYMTTQMSLQKTLVEFQMDWVMLWKKVQNGQPTLEQEQDMLARLKTFRLRVMSTIEQEMQTWVMEFKTNLIQLEESARARLEAKRLETQPRETPQPQSQPQDASAHKDCQLQ